MAVLWYYLFAFGEEGRERRFGNVNWVEKGKERILERVEEYSTVCVCVCVCVVCLEVRGGILLTVCLDIVEN